MTLTENSTRTIERPQDAWTTRGSRVSIAAEVHGFGGLHGGIALAMAVQALFDDGFEPLELRSVHARYDHAIRDHVDVEIVSTQRRGIIDHAAAQLVADGRVCVSVAATFGRSTVDTAPSAPSRPGDDRPTDHGVFALPPELAPFGQFVEIRPTTPARPFAGCLEPHLAAWIRLRGDDAPVDLPRLLVLMDALAPSAAAPMTDFFSLPTVELTIRPTPQAHTATSPWVLLDTRSNVSTDGWADETIVAWAPDGTHLASATQLRVATTLGAAS